MPVQAVSGSGATIVGLPGASGLCATFAQRAVHTWNYLKDGERTGIRLSEETLTDMNLLEIKRAHPGAVGVVKFDKVKEGTQTGADWEWWLGSARKKKWISMRIQAKKLNRESLTYEKIN